MSLSDKLISEAVLEALRQGIPKNPEILLFLKSSEDKLELQKRPMGGVPMIEVPCKIKVSIFLWVQRNVGSLPPLHLLITQSFTDNNESWKDGCQEIGVSVSISNTPLEEISTSLSLERLAKAEKINVPFNPLLLICRVAKSVRLWNIEEGMVPFNISPPSCRYLSLYKLLRHGGMLPGYES